MSRLNFIRLHHFAMLLALTIALVGTGFAHRISPVEDQRLAFVLATGAVVADLCDDATPGGGHLGPSCLACQIAGGADLPPVLGTLTRLDLNPVARIVVTVDSDTVPRRPDHSHVPQAPPVA
jgi:hypothetical protein